MRGEASPYDVLGVSQGAEEVVVEAAYRALIKKYHPDHSDIGQGGPSAAGINAAYAALKDPERRTECDRRLRAREQAVTISPAPPERRRTNLAGWSGWTVALLLGGALAAVATGHLRTPAPRLQVATADEAVAAAKPTEPEADESIFSRVTRSSGLGAAPATAAVAAAAASPGPEAGVAAPALREARAAAPRRAAREPRRGRTAQGAETQRARTPGTDRDFREREGYIY